MTDTENPRSNRAAQKNLQSVISHVAGVIVACGLLMWSVFNFWLNVLAFRANEQPDQAWGITFGLVIVTCVLPFLIGLALLFKTLGKDTSNPGG